MDALRSTRVRSDHDSFLYVDYFLLDGSVVHLFPLTASQRKPQRAGAGITLGQAGGGSTREWQVSSPFGSEMLVAVAAQEPLFAAPRPETDTSKDYLPL
jgi:eukaryotic-like serine/threonine-protein kinase